MRSGISSGIKVGHFNNPENDQRALQGQIAQQQYQSNALAMQTQQDTLQRSDQIRQAVSQIDPNAPDWVHQVQSVRRLYGDVGGALKMGERLTSLDEASQKKALHEADMLSRDARGVNNQSTYDALIARHPGAARNFGTEYDPANVQEIVFGALDAGEYANQLNSDRSHKLAEIGETQPYPLPVVAQQIAVANAKRPENTTNIKLGTEDTEWQKALVNEFVLARDEASAAEGQIMSLRQLQKMAPTAGIGLSAPTKVQLGKWLGRFGIDPAVVGIDNMTEAEAFIAVAEKLVLDVMATQKGPQTNEDRNAIRATIANLGNTPKGAAFMLRSAIAVRERQIKKAAIFRAHKSQTGSLEGAYEAWTDYQSIMPLMGRKLSEETNLPVFYTDWYERTQEANPRMTQKQIDEIWGIKNRRQE
jgi:hypothetical protein